MNERNTFIIKLLASHLFLVPVILFAFFSFNIPWFGVLIPQTILLILFFAGYWEFLGTKVKLIICGIYQIMILLITTAGLPFENRVTEGLTFMLFISLAELYLLLLLGKIVWVISKHEKENFEIEFPFRNGTYLITDGGNSAISRLMNYHFHAPVHKKRNTNLSMKHATDIVRLSKEKRKFFPPANEDYAVFGEAVYCPMDGTVVKVINEIDDNIPFSGNYPYNTGNTVVIKNDNYYLLLGHLKKESIVVKPGNSVKKNEIIGNCGNSGMSERPHLHMQLIKCEDGDFWKGLGINMLFKRKNLYKNRIIKN